MFFRALLAFLALPGLVAFVIPLVFIRSPGDRLMQQFGLLPILTGTVLLLWCVRDFYRTGKGTLAPWDPPRKLVSVGLYQRSRNPMYVAVTLILVGWAMGFRSRALLLYTVVTVIVFYIRVLAFEEPWLARTHGEEWERYRARVPRWGVLRPTSIKKP